MSDEIPQQTDPLDLANRDVVAEADALLAAKKAEQAKAQATHAVRLQLHQLESMAQASGDTVARVERIERDLAATLAQLDPDLKPEVRARREAEAQREAAGALDAVHRQLLGQLEQARATATLFDGESLRRLATFDADPLRDATIRTAWSLRLDKAPPRVVAAWARRAAETGDIALAAVVEEELFVRSEAKDLDRKSLDHLAAARASIASVVPADAKRAAEALDRLESSERQVRERLRLLNGGRPGGRFAIAEGLRQRQQQAS